MVMNKTKASDKDDYQYIMDNLKVCCYEGSATAETFENVIKAHGLTQEVIVLLSSYYKKDIEEEVKVQDNLFYGKR